VTEPPPPQNPCGADFAEHTRHLFVDVAQARAIASGRRPARRAVFRKLHGVVHGRLELDHDRPDWTRQGLFERDAFPCWGRFSSDVPPDADDAGNGTIGLALKLFGAPTPSLALTDPGAPTADLVLQNHDVFFVDTGEDMCRFTDLSLAGRGDEWDAAHPDTPRIFTEMAKHEASLRSATYWSVLPYACGSNRTVKYRLRGETPPPAAAVGADPNRLATDLVQGLAAGEVGFALEIQTAEPGVSLPVDRGTVRWEAVDAPWTTLGRLVLPRQDINKEGQATYGETLSFSPWRTPEANRPLGSIAQSRRLAYPSSAAQRHWVNGHPDAEPHAPRQP
jgi:hypothetical protein